MKRFLVAFLSIIILLGAVCVPASAKASTVISLSNKELTVKQNLVVTVTVNADEAMYGMSFTLSYDPDVIRFDSGNDASGGAGVVKVAGGVTGLKKISYVLNFTALKSGSSSISVKDCMYGDKDYKDISVSGAGVNVTVKDKTKSKNANLKSLRIDDGDLSPAFSPNVTSYTAKIPYNVTVCKVYTRTEDSDAKVSVSGSPDMKVGKNVRSVIVTAPNGNQKEYKITITREEKKEDTTSSEDAKEQEEALRRRTVLINDSTYEVLTKAADIILPDGFTKGVGKYNDEKVAIAEDPKDKYTLYYLKDTETNKVITCTLDKEDNSFKAVAIFTSGDKTYIVEDCDDSKGAPVDTYFGSVKIKDNYVNGFTPKDPALSGFYYISCYINGVSEYYRYDSVMDTLQREPGLKFAADTVGEGIAEDPSTPEVAKGNFLERFASLEPTAKTIVVALALIVVVIIVLIILVIVGSVKARKEESAYFEAISNDAEPVAEGFIFEDEEVEAAQDEQSDDNF